MTDADGPEAEPHERLITANQLVAHNLALFRKGAGMTQEELAGKLMAYSGESWSKATVSAAERSFDEGGRVREFDANDLLAFSLALGVPPVGFLLPPADDGSGTRYKIGGASTRGGISEERLVEVLFRNPTQERARNVDLYLVRVRDAFARYLPDASGSEIPSYLLRQELEESLIQLEERIRDAGQAAERVRRSVERGQEEEPS